MAFKPEPPATNVEVDSLVAVRNYQPYIRVILTNGKGERLAAQLSVADARKIAADIVQAAARAETDAMVRRFFAKKQYPQGAADALMMEFRDFRRALDQEPVEGTMTNPDDAP